MLLQQGIPETTVYMIGGYVVIFGVMALYLLSLYVRRKNLNRDLQMLEELEEVE